MSTAVPTEAREDLKAVRQALAKMHSAMLAVLKAQYEKKHGHAISPFTWLQLMYQDPDLQWMRPAHEILLETDILIDEKDLTSPDLEKVRARILSLIDEDMPGTEFTRHFQAVVQSEPALASTLPTLKQSLSQARFSTGT